MLLSILLIADRTNLLAMMLLFILLHELGHLVGFVLCGIKIKSLSLVLFGIRIKREAITKGMAREIFVYLSGCMMNLLVILLAIFLGNKSEATHMIITINLVMMLFNLLPIGALDGGNILKIILTKYTSIEKFERIFRGFSVIMLIPLFAIAIYLLLSESRNPTLLITCFYLLYSSINT